MRKNNFNKYFHFLVAAIVTIALFGHGKIIGAKDRIRRLAMRDSTWTERATVALDSNATQAVWILFKNSKRDFIDYTGVVTLVGRVDTASTVTWANSRDSLSSVAWLLFPNRAKLDTVKKGNTRLAYEVIANPVTGDTTHVTTLDYNWGTAHADGTYQFSAVLNVRACAGLKIVTTNGPGASACTIGYEAYVTEDR